MNGVNRRYIFCSSPVERNDICAGVGVSFGFYFAVSLM